MRAPAMPFPVPCACARRTPRRFRRSADRSVPGDPRWWPDRRQGRPVDHCLERHYCPRLGCSRRQCLSCRSCPLPGRLRDSCPRFRPSAPQRLPSVGYPALGGPIRGGPTRTANPALKAARRMTAGPNYHRSRCCPRRTRCRSASLCSKWCRSTSWRHCCRHFSAAAGTATRCRHLTGWSPGWCSGSPRRWTARKWATTNPEVAATTEAAASTGSASKCSPRNPPGPAHRRRARRVH